MAVTVGNEVATSATPFDFDGLRFYALGKSIPVQATLELENVVSPLSAHEKYAIQSVLVQVLGIVDGVEDILLVSVSEPLTRRRFTDYNNEYDPDAFPPIVLDRAGASMTNDNGARYGERAVLRTSSTVSIDHHDGAASTPGPRSEARASERQLLQATTRSVVEASVVGWVREYARENFLEVLNQPVTSDQLTAALTSRGVKTSKVSLKGFANYFDSEGQLVGTTVSS